jgi:hypothetical protein
MLPQILRHQQFQIGLTQVIDFHDIPDNSAFLARAVAGYRTLQRF